MTASFRPRVPATTDEHAFRDTGMMFAAGATRRSYRRSDLGQEQTSLPFQAMSALPPKADIDAGLLHVGFGPEADSNAPQVNLRRWLSSRRLRTEPGNMLILHARRYDR
jgi:hypothetical protein